MKGTSFAIIFTIFLTHRICVSEDPLPILKNIPVEGRLQFCELANKYSFECIRYNVTTEDGYILGVFNIPGNKSKPILLQHGILDSSDTFMIRGNLSLVAYLSNQGYDVWLGNARGNKHSRAHVSLKPNSLEFWEFSYHEIAIYDLPAIIDFILEKTNQDKLHYIGHSQGTTVFFVLGSMRPEYNNKVHIVVCYGPIAYLHNSEKRTFPEKMMLVGPAFSRIISSFTHGEILSNQSTMVGLMRDVCSQENGYALCLEKFLFHFWGSDSEEIEPAFFLVTLAHFPSGTSSRNYMHEVQAAFGEHFAQYDFGILKNLVVYNSTTPPNYDLSKVTANIAIIAGMGDKMGDLKDIQLLREQLPNVVDYHVMNRTKYNHVDFVWGRHNEDLFERTRYLLNKYSK